MATDGQADGAVTVYEHQHYLCFRVPEDAQTWPARMEAASCVLDAAFPSAKLQLANAYNAGVPAKVLGNRERYFKGRLKTRTRWFSLQNGGCNAPEGSNRGENTFVTMGGKLDIGAPQSCTVLLVFPGMEWRDCAGLMADLGDALAAWTAQLSPARTFQRLRQVQWGHRFTEDLAWLENKLPKLRYCMYGGLLANEQPEILGWLNYWSPATCAYIGFPDQARDRDLLSCSTQTRAGAWLVKLGVDPLDLDVPRHVELLQNTYARFPALGIRL